MWRWAEIGGDLVTGGSRGLSLALGGFAGLGLLGRLAGSALDANTWWIDLQRLPGGVGLVLLLATALVLPPAALLPRPFRGLRLAARLVVGVLVVVALVNTVDYYRLLRSERLAGGAVVPFSLVVVLVLLALLPGLIRRPVRSLLLVRFGLWGVFPLVAVLFPLGQMALYGMTDYRREASVAVVLGCRAWPDGRLSGSLEDRVRTGCELYHQGLVGHLVFSGGPLPEGGGPDVHEPAMMRAWALRHGVPDRAIIMDPAGVNTAATAANMAALFLEAGIDRALVVSHFYHLARVKLAFQEAGVRVYTVPARRHHPMPGLPFYLAREVAALWVYWLRALVS